MTTRTYNSEARRRKQAELKAKIAAATAALHARKGAIATSYADIAAEAGVSLPTVYAHYPTQRELLEGCTGHVASGAPPLPVDELLAAPDLATAAARLTDAVEALHRHFEPWLAWREDRVIPFLAELAADRRAKLGALLARILARHRPHDGPAERREAVAGWETVLSFDFWHRLTHAHGLTRAAARRVIVRCLLAVAAPSVPTSPATPSAPSTPQAHSPTSRRKR